MENHLWLCEVNSIESNEALKTVFHNSLLVEWLLKERLRVINVADSLGDGTSTTFNYKVRAHLTDASSHSGNHEWT